ncbi:hypothetical protein JCM5296_003109 [Sporobolomyces johnsonii]
MLGSSIVLPFALLAAAVTPALAQLSSFRATIPGALHQCEATNLFFFFSSNDRPLSVLFLPSSKVPDSLRTGTTTLDEAQQYSPLLALSDITTPDASAYDFTLQIAQGEVFEIFGFLPDGSGKALSLTRTVMTPLPSASSCLTNIPTSIAGAGSGSGATTTAAAAAQSTSTAAAAASSVSKSMSTSAVAASTGSKSSSSVSSTSTSGAASSTISAASGTSNTSSASKPSSLDAGVVVAWTVALGGAAVAATGGELSTDNAQPPDRLDVPSASSASSIFAFVPAHLQQPHPSYLADNPHPARSFTGSSAPMPLLSHQPLPYALSSGFQPLASQTYPGPAYRRPLTPYSPYSMSAGGAEDSGAGYSGQQQSGEGGLRGATAAAGDDGVSSGISSTVFAHSGHQLPPEHHPPQRRSVLESSWRPHSAHYAPHPPLPVDTLRTSQDEQSGCPSAPPYGHTYPPAFWHHQQPHHSSIGTPQPAPDLELGNVYRPRSPSFHVPSFVPNSYTEDANPHSHQPPLAYSHPRSTSYSLLALATEQRHAPSPTDADAVAGPSRLIPSSQPYHPSTSFAPPPPQPAVGLTLPHVATTNGSAASLDHSPVPSPDLAPGIVHPPTQHQPIVSHIPPQVSSEQASGLTKKRRAPKDAAARKYACEECEQRFARPSALATHILTHTKEKPFVCSSCNRGFAVMSNLRRHCRVRNHILTAEQTSTVRPRGERASTDSNSSTASASAFNDLSPSTPATSAAMTSFPPPSSLGLAEYTPSGAVIPSVFLPLSPSTPG